MCDMKSILLAIRLAFSNLRTNTARTIVTLSGIIVSIAAIILVVSAGESVKGFVLSQIETFGTDLIQVEVRVPSGKSTQDRSSESVAGAANIKTLKIEDGEAIARLPNVGSVYVAMIGQALAQYFETNKQILIFGTTADVVKVDANLRLAGGTFYSENDDDGLRDVVVLGSGVKQSFFGGSDALGRKIKIKGESYTVVGVLKERGSAGFFDFDSIVYMPLKTLQKKILGIDHASMISVRVKDPDIIDRTAEDIRWVMRDQHRIDDPKDDDFEVASVKEAQETIGNVFGAINILLLALASISLIVGGVGIMNVMFVAVSERMGEIGLRKAVGARSGDVLKQFLIEAVVISVTGGALGIMLGVSLLFVGIHVLQSFGFAVDFILTIRTLLIAVGFSAGAGVLFGVYPAWRASQVPPVVAMRRE